MRCGGLAVGTSLFLLVAVGTPKKSGFLVFQQTLKIALFDFQYITILLDHPAPVPTTNKNKFKLIFNILKFCWNVGLLEHKITGK
jgi:hypothetical protein